MCPADPPLTFRESAQLSEHTTIGLGGPARLFIDCDSVESVRSAILFARENGKRWIILGDGSNVIFPDHGFDGLVVRMSIRGIQRSDQDRTAILSAAAGENWDGLVKRSVDEGLAGIECLSGIPGRVGATPLQNVGAYGQEVAESIVSVHALNSSRLEPVQFSARECGFGYRSSRFKGADAGQYIVTEVRFKLRKNGDPRIAYPELSEYLGRVSRSAGERPDLRAVRSAVLALRRKKSMIIDPADPNARSVGSFFINPVLSTEQYRDLQDRWKATGNAAKIMHYPVSGGVKIPAAWLVEHTGFPRGYRRKGAGISANHALALVNRGGTTQELLDLASEIQDAVLEKFGIRLEREPHVVE
jgi:UDP-N-acetylmuramate dehydrogenase